MSDAHGQGQSPATPPQGERAIEGERRRGMLSRVARRTRASAEISFPAAPSLTTYFVDVLADTFAALGRPFSGPEIATLTGILREKLREAFEASPLSSVLVKYHTAEDGSMRLDYGIAAVATSLSEQYAHWVETRDPPLFGAHADARVMEAAKALAKGARVVDLGAGTGRNSLALARLGLDVDAVEPAAALAGVLEAEAAKEGLAVRVTRADATAEPLPFPAGQHALVVASQVTPHFRSDAELRAFFRQCATLLAPGGQAIVSVFLTVGEYQPDPTTRELGKVLWTTFYTPSDLEEALRDLPLAKVEEHDAREYEKAHLPADAWPPTGWFEGWSRGDDLFGAQSRPSVSLRWVVLERTAGDVPAA